MSYKQVGSKTLAQMNRDNTQRYVRTNDDAEDDLDSFKRRMQRKHGANWRAFINTQEQETYNQLLKSVARERGVKVDE